MGTDVCLATSGPESNNQLEPVPLCNKTQAGCETSKLTAVTAAPLPLQVNPPYYVKLVELVPHPDTAASVVDTTHQLMTKVEMTSSTSNVLTCAQSSKSGHLQVKR